MTCLLFFVLGHSRQGEAAPLEIDFEGAYNGDFVIAEPSHFVADSADGFFYYTNVQAQIEGVNSVVPYLEFYDAAHLGGLSAANDLMAREDSELDLRVSQLFSGPVTNPTLIGGSYAFPLGEITEQVFVPTVSAVPLPSAAPLFGAGLVALATVGYSLNRRRKGGPSEPLRSAAPPAGA